MEENDELNIYSNEVRDVLSQPPKSIFRWGNTILFFFIAMILFLSWLIKYPDTVIAKAIITTEIPPQKEYAMATGVFDAILVENNEQVNANQPLAIIENTANYKDAFKLKSVIDTIQVNSKNFSFPLDSLPLLFLGDIESQYALFENNYIQYELNKELQPFSNEAIANRYSISELNRRLQSLKSQKEINQTELIFQTKDLQRNKTLFDKGVISVQEYENKQLEYAQAERNFKSFESSISQIREGISNASMTSRGTEINRAKEEMVLLKNVIQSFNQLKKSIKDWEKQYVLQSKIDGTVSFLNFWNVNQTVNAGDLVFTIIPDKNSFFIAKLKTPTQNSGKIKVGQNVYVRLENFPDVEFGVLKGKVKNISLIPDQEGLYLIDVELPEKLITSYNKEIEFKHEMPGMAEIVTEDLRLIERFFYQFKGILKRN